MTTLVIDSVSKSFVRADGTAVHVVRDLSISLSGDRFAALLGPNGCGKTTLLGMVAGLVKADSGTISLCPDGGSEPRMGYVWQDYRSSLLPWLSAVENIAFPLRPRSVPRVERRQRARAMMEEFMPGVDPRTPCYRMSGGQQQMLCLLRSAISQPDVLLFDEPFSALDQNRRWAMATYVERIWTAVRCPALFISHDVDEAVLLADDIILMTQDGRIGATLDNPLPRPRKQTMLTDKTHVECRDQVIDFLLEQGALVNGVAVGQCVKR